jgi:hypothetical protein
MYHWLAAGRGADQVRLSRSQSSKYFSGNSHWAAWPQPEIEKEVSHLFGPGRSYISEYVYNFANLASLTRTPERSLKSLPRPPI